MAGIMMDRGWTTRSRIVAAVRRRFAGRLGSTWNGVAATCLALGLLSYGGPADAQTVEVGIATKLQIQYAGQTRAYLVYVPRSLASIASRPAVLLLHGNGGSGSNMMGLSRLNRLAEAEGFVAVYPETPQGRPWSDGRPATDGYDDVGYILRVVDELSRYNGVDAGRAYLGGASSGGMMAQRMACEASSDFVAVGVVAAHLTEALAATCTPGRALPMIFFSGTADPSIPFDGANWIRSQAGTRDFWKAQADCTRSTGPVAQPDEYNDGTTVSLEQIDQCAGPHLGLDFYVIEGGGHTWPGAENNGSPRNGLTSQEVNATAAMVEFFTRYGL